MYSYLSYRIELHKLSKERKKCIAKRDDSLANRDCDEESTYLTEDIDFIITDEAIENLKSKYLMDRAVEFVIPVSKITDNPKNWVRSDITRKSRLTIEAMEELQSLVRKESKERREQFATWLAGITGLLGALTGLISVF